MLMSSVMTADSPRALVPARHCRLHLADAGAVCQHLPWAAREAMSSGGPAYKPLVATELARSSSVEPSSSADNETAGANGSPTVGLAPVTVSLSRINHDPYHAFVEGAFIEEGYVHRSPKPLGPMPYDGMLRCIWAVCTLPCLLTCALIVVAHCGWWTVTATGDSSGNKIMLAVPVSDTAQFRVIVAFGMFMGFSGFMAYLRCLLIHRELAMSTVRGLTTAERLARFSDNEPRLRLQNLFSGCAALYVAMRPPTVHPLGAILCQILLGMMAVMWFLAMSYKYMASYLMMVSAPFVRDKTSLRTVMARSARLYLVSHLFNLVVFVRLTTFLIRQTDVILMPTINPCALHSNESLWHLVEADCIDHHGFRGPALCEVNLLGFPFASYAVAFICEQYSPAALSPANALTNMTTEILVPVAAILVVVIPTVLNIVAISTGESDDGVCGCLAYTIWAVPCLGELPVLGIMVVANVPNLVEQYCPSKALRKCNCAYQSYLGKMTEASEQVALGGVREARWELRGEFACFLSHFKAEAAGDARHLKDKLAGKLNAPVFLDSDDLLDLRELLEIVARSDILLLLQTTNVLTRPWCLLELYTAICNHVPIVAVAVEGSFPYSFDEATALLDGTDESSFAERLASRHPAAVDIIRKHPIPVRGVFIDVDIEELGQALKNHLPNL